MTPTIIIALFFVIILFLGFSTTKLPFIGLLFCILGYFNVLSSYWFDIAIKVLIAIEILFSLNSLYKSITPKTDEEIRLASLILSRPDSWQFTLVKLMIFIVFTIVYLKFR